MRYLQLEQALPRVHAPLPSTLDSHNLGKAFSAAFLFEQHVVGGAGVEGRVEIDQVNAGVFDVIAENFKVVAEVKLILGFHYRTA